jgi:hypothetical protein
MHVEDAEHLLMIHPTRAPSGEPVVDDLTRRMAGALSRADRVRPTRGQHRCTGPGCRALSGSSDLGVEGYVTNSLAVHYLAHHRAEVPCGELAKVATLDGPDVAPTPEQLSGRRR